jgi:predicted RNA-binding Zn ribbon-like protein
MVSRPELPEQVGGALALDFVNTRDAWLNDARRHEFLPDYDALVAWALATGAVAAPPRRRGDEAAVHARALALRDALFGVFAPLATGGRPGAGAIAGVNDAWAALETRPCLDPTTLAPAWTGTPDQPLGPVLASALALLRDGPLDRLRQCPGPDGWCGWLFIDRTKNRSRRWCSMAVCGNPAKMRARAARRRAAAP